MFADLIVNAYTTTKFIRNKTCCPDQYRRFSEAATNDSTEMGLLKTDAVIAEDENTKQEMV